MADGRWSRRPPAMNHLPSAISHQPWQCSVFLLEMLAYELRHLEHVDGGLAAEHWLQRLVRLDHPFVLLVLQAVLLDVRPQLLRHLRARNRLRPDNFGER